MRFESKNKEMKHFVTNCYINVPYSVSVHHQQSSCFLLAVRPGEDMSTFLYAGDEIISCTFPQKKKRKIIVLGILIMELS